MIITIKRKFQDSVIDREIREYGITAMAKKITMDRSYLNQCLISGVPINEKDYKKICRVLYNKDVEFNFTSNR